MGTKVGFSGNVEVQLRWWRNKHGDMFLSHSQERKGSGGCNETRRTRQKHRVEARLTGDDERLPTRGRPGRCRSGGGMAGGDEVSTGWARDGADLVAHGSRAREGRERRRWLGPMEEPGEGGSAMDRARGWQQRQWSSSGGSGWLLRTAGWSRGASGSGGRAEAAGERSQGRDPGRGARSGQQEAAGAVVEDDGREVAEQIQGAQGAAEVDRDGAGPGQR